MIRRGIKKNRAGFIRAEFGEYLPDNGCYRLVVFSTNRPYADIFHGMQFYYIFTDALISGVGPGSIKPMNKKKCFLLLLTALIFLTSTQAQKTYDLIPKKSGKVNKALVAALPIHLKAMAALYSAMGGTDCLEQECVLTTALGLGKQGSDSQKNLIRKYFPEDKVAALVLGQDCYLPPGSSSSFSNFLSLSFTVDGNTVLVNYRLAVYDHGNTKIMQGPDRYQYQHERYKNTRRVLYAWANK